VVHGCPARPPAEPLDGGADRRPPPLCLHVEEHAHLLAHVGRVQRRQPGPLQQLIAAGPAPPRVVLSATGSRGATDLETAPSRSRVR
jgi:hypothetical protein